jgi:mutual gliding-motility protein MglA
MVFFNYSTMQMAAKVVYYGPGLCGKTTNLHYIYGHTSGDSRGEMVSLETETDRTLFFDLLPIDVGQIAGFNTRIQLYTVPGQVFYNTTRKLVLKGVDGVVFVADSQRAMQQANIESFKNLEENLAEMGLATDSLPLVLQYNKRDLADISTVEEMNRYMNPHNWPWFEASALTGQGVFETLKGVSKLTLLSLKKRLTRGGESAAPPARTAPSAVSRPVAAAPAAPAPPAAARPAAPAPGPPPAPPRLGSAPAAPPAAPAPTPARTAAPQAPAPTAPAAKAPAPAAPKAPAAGKPAPRSRSVDVLGELEKLRREAMQPATAAATPATPATPASSGAHPIPAPPAPPARPAPAPAPPAATPAGAASPHPAARNGRGELSRNIELTLKRSDFERARRFLVSFQVEDEQNRVMDSVRDLAVEIKDIGSLEKLLLRLNIALNAKE